MSKYTNISKTDVFKGDNKQLIISTAGLFAQTANSTPITNTAVETSLVNGGVGTLSVPANGFAVGDSFTVIIGGVLNCANNQTITLRVKDGTSILADSGAKTISNITNNVFSLNINFTVRQLGPAGVASIVCLATFHYTKTVNGVTEGFAFNTVNSTTFDTTGTNELFIRYSTANATVTFVEQYSTMTRYY